MVLITLYNTEKGMQRLLTAPADIQLRVEERSTIKLENASIEHQALFSSYVKSMNEAYQEAAIWWEDIILALQDRTGLSKEESIKESFLNRLAGAASHPSVVGVIRKFWLRCDALNKTHKANQVYCEVLLLKWLADSGETELTKLVACMPYWPIGLNEAGEWC